MAVFNQSNEVAA